MKQENFYNTDIKEQETIVNVDYERKVASFYTSRKTVYNRMIGEIGQPTKYIIYVRK